MFYKWLLQKSKLLSRKGLYEFLLKEYAVIPGKSEVLSIGSGGEVNDLLRAIAKRNDFSITTFDIDAARYPDIVGDICCYSFGDKQYDVVIMCEVLEHLHSPHLGIKNVYNILKPCGSLIASAPFVFPLHDRPHDYYRFTRYGLEFLLKQFRLVDIKERNTYFEAIQVLWARLLVSNCKSARLASMIIIPYVYYIGRFVAGIMSKIMPTDAMTTGYVIKAIK